MAKKLETKKALPTYKFPGKPAVIALARACNISQNKIDTIAGEMGGEIAAAVKNKSLHKGAFQQARRFLKMGENDPGKLRVFLAHLDYYRETFALDKLADTQADFIADEEEEEVKAAKKAGAKKPASPKQKLKDFAKKSEAALDESAKVVAARDKKKDGADPKSVADRAEASSADAAALAARQQENAAGADLRH